MTDVRGDHDAWARSIEFYAYIALANLTTPFDRAGRRRGAATISLLIVIACFVFPTVAIWPFPPKRFSGNSLIDAGSLGLSGEGRVVAFGDFNGDQLFVVCSVTSWHCYELPPNITLDVLVLGSVQKTLSVYHWNHGMTPLNYSIIVPIYIFYRDFFVY